MSACRPTGLGFSDPRTSQRSAETQAKSDEPAAVSPSAVVADFNRDGRLDVAVANHDSDNVSVLLNQRERLVGDVDDDGDVDLADLAGLLGAYGACASDANYDPNADFDASGCVDLWDLINLLSNYGAGT